MGKSHTLNLSNFLSQVLESAPGKAIPSDKMVNWKKIISKKSIEVKEGNSFGQTATANISYKINQNSFLE